MVSVRVEGYGLEQLKKLRSNLQSANTKLLRQADKTVQEIAVLGKNHARKVAPVDTGALINAIVVRKTGDKGVELVSGTPDNPKHKLYPYNVFMTMYPHGTSEHPRRYASGDPEFMLAALRYMQNVAPRKAEKIVTVVTSEILNY